MQNLNNHTYTYMQPMSHILRQHDTAISSLFKQHIMTPNQPQVPSAAKILVAVEERASRYKNITYHVCTPKTIQVTILLEH